MGFFIRLMPLILNLLGSLGNLVTNTYTQVQTLDPKAPCLPHLLEMKDKLAGANESANSAHNAMLETLGEGKRSAK